MEAAGLAEVKRTEPGRIRKLVLRMKTPLAHGLMRIQCGYLGMRLACMPAGKKGRCSKMDDMKIGASPL